MPLITGSSGPVHTTLKRRKKYLNTMADKVHYYSLIRYAANTANHERMGNPMLFASIDSDCVTRGQEAGDPQITSLSIRPLNSI